MSKAEDHTRRPHGFATEAAMAAIVTHSIRRRVTAPATQSWMTASTHTKGPRTNEPWTFAHTATANGIAHSQFGCSRRPHTTQTQAANNTAPNICGRSAMFSY